jgi:hypothetical protein
MTDLDVRQWCKPFTEGEMQLSAHAAHSHEIELMPHQQRTQVNRAARLDT